MHQTSDMMANFTEGHKQSDITTEVSLQRSINADRTVRRSSRNIRERLRHASGNDNSERIQQKLRRITNLNDRILLRRYELQHDDQNFVACGSLMAESAEKLVGIVDVVLSGDHIDLHRAQLEASHAQLIGDITTFKTKSSYVQDLRHNIAQDEARLKRRIEKLSILLKLVSMPHDQDVVGEPLPEVESNTSSECSQIESSTPSLLRQFYDRKGDVGIFEERLTDLEYNYQENLVERDMIRDRGDEVDLTDTQHHEQYLSQRKTILDDLDKAEYETAQLLQKCRQLGLEIGAHLGKSLVQSTSIGQHPDITDTTFPLPVSEPFRRVGGFENTLTQAMNSSHVRVRDWLQTVPQEDPKPLRPSTSEIGRRRTWMAVSNHHSPRAWQSCRTQDVTTAAMMISAASLVPFDHSNFNIGLSMRRWKSDPACLNWISQQYQLQPEPSDCLHPRSSAEGQSNLRPPHTENVISNHNVTERHGNHAAVATPTPSKDPSWLKKTMDMAWKC